MRKIIHIDMDFFFAAIECRDDPSVAEKPVGVGGSSGRGVLTTCNYIARDYGCRSAMPVFKALELCPHLIIKPIRFDVYRRESKRIRAVFLNYTELVEPLSLDEAYLDVSHHKRFAYDTIESADRSRTKIIDGWGIHWVPGRGMTYNLWGFDCVEFDVGKRQVRVGSDDVDNLVAFLRHKTA